MGLVGGGGGWWGVPCPMLSNPVESESESDMVGGFDGGSAAGTVLGSLAPAVTGTAAAAGPHTAWCLAINLQGWRY